MKSVVIVSLYYLSKKGDEVIIKRSRQKLNLVHPTDYNYFNTLSSKLGWSKKCSDFLCLATLLYKNQFILYVITDMFFIQERHYADSINY